MFRKLQFTFDLSKELSLDKNKAKIKNFKVRSEQLEQVYSDYQEVTERINLLQLEISPTSKPDFQSISAFEDIYFEIRAFEASFFEATPTATQASLGSGSDKPAQPRLPKIEVPKFDGSLKNWTVFYDKFKSLIHDNTSINPVEKFHYLLSAVTGPALSVVRSLPLTEVNYEIVWDSLIAKYHNKRVLATDLLDTLVSFKPFTRETISSFTEFLAVFKDSVTALKALQIDNLSDFILVYLALRSLPFETRKQFELQYTSRELPSFDDVTEFIQKQVNALEVSKGLNSRNQIYETCFPDKSPHKHISPRVRKAFTATSSGPPNSCPVCKLGHKIYFCPTYLKMTPMQRKKFIRDMKHCFNCLKSHMLDSCPSKLLCTVCGSKHHSSLHASFERSDNFQITSLHKPSTSGTSQSSPLADSKCCFSASGFHSDPSFYKTVLLGTAVVHLRDFQGKYVPVRALIDSGAQTSFITSACAQRLGLPVHRCDLPIAGLGQSLVTNIKGMTSCTLKPRHSCNPLLQTEAIILPQITTNMPSLKVPINICNKYAKLTLADPNYDTPSAIDFLIAADLCPFLYDGQRILGEGGPSALHSIFGWVITGEITVPSPTSFHLTVSHLSTADRPLDELLKRFWQCEEPPLLHSAVNPDDAKCERLFQDSFYRTKDGRYVVPLPFRDNNVTLSGDTYSHALSRLLSMERRLNKLPELSIAYNDFLREYERLGHMTRVVSQGSDSKTYIIPHHAVFKASSSTTKLRVVFDGSSLPSNGQSLNSQLLVGPKLQGDIVNIVCRFRLHKFVFTADISKMFRQIWIRESDRAYQHILWRPKTGGPVEEYELNTITYGLAPSPYLAQRSLQQLSLDECTKFPLAAPVLVKDIFIDDILTGTSDLNSAKALKSELIGLLASGGFELRKWSSNSKDLLNDLPTDHLETPLTFNEDGFEVIKVLGLQWNSTNDTFSYHISLSDVPCSKRSILSLIARLYDPLGWLSPVIFRAKCLIQHLWREGVGWDDPVPSYISTEWSDFCCQLPLLSNLEIPRYLLQPDPTSICLVGFADASERGYSAVIYLVVYGKNNSSKLLIAKSKVAPLNILSIPRLELCGALLLSRLLKYSMTIFENNLMFSNVYAFTDSTTVLAWLKTPTYLLKTFVATRVTQILHNTSPTSWYHVPTEFNPADCSSRGLQPQTLPHHLLWWHGPSWLVKPFPEWPLRSPLRHKDTDLPELKNQNTVYSFLCSNSTPWELIENSSSFTRLQRVTAWCFRFKSNLTRPKEQRYFGPLTFPELQHSLTFLIKCVQQDYFQNDLCLLSKGQPCQVSIQRLNPFLDSAGLLRVGGRLKHASLPSDSIHPIVLPKSCHFTNILIDYYHLKFLHVGPRTLQSLLLRNFWILSARGVIRSRLSKCMICFRSNASPKHPLMADLPRPRVTQGRPFINVGIDFGGPFVLKESKRRNGRTSKCYLCLFICFSTKAVHLELVSDLSTDAFLAALDRFVARRGLCHNIFTDCGTNFIGAKRYICEMFDIL